MDKRASCVIAIFIALMACSADPEPSGRDNRSFGGAAAAPPANAGMGGASGIAGDYIPPTAMTGGSGGAPPSNEECAATAAEAEVGREPADIVWLVDNSCSMAIEAVAVQTNMNRFAQKLVDSGIDVHLVLISSANTSYQMNTACPPDDFVCSIGMLVGAFTDFGVCIGAPFGSGMCPNDSLAPNFLHLAYPVGSTNGCKWPSTCTPNTSR